MNRRDGKERMKKFSYFFSESKLQVVARERTNETDIRSLNSFGLYFVSNLFAFAAFDRVFAIAKLLSDGISMQARSAPGESRTEKR